MDEDVVIVRLSKQSDPSHAEEVQATQGLAELLACSARINDFARRFKGYNKHGFEISFKSLLLAFLISDDTWSQWFRPYVDAKEASGVPELLESRRLDRKELDSIESQLSEIDPSELGKVRRQTQDGKLLVDAARELCKETPPQDADRPLDVRHLIGAYIYNPPDRPEGSERQNLDSWGYDRLGWSNAFLTQIAKRNSTELEFWNDIHVRTFSIPAEITIPSAAGYIPDSVDAEATDHLDIEREVENIAYVLTSTRVTPPLSLGLFGDWGSGKSFFMTKLEKYIGAMADYYRKEEQVTGVTSEWCSRVVQIKFNAWHFSDANLWASLVTRIYDALSQELSGQDTSDATLRKRLEEEVKSVEGVVHQAQIESQEAETRVDVATTAFQQAQERRRTHEASLNGMIGDIGDLLGDSSETRAQLDEAANALGFPEAAKSYAALEELDTNLKSFSSRLSAVAVSVLRSPWTLLLLALLAIGLPILVSFLLGQYLEALGGVAQRVAEISTFLFGLIAWLKVQLGRGLGFVESIETNLERARRARQQRIEESPEVKQAQQELTLAQSEEQVAQQNVQQAQAELQRLQSEIEELRPERKLYRLIEERGRAATYTQQLGIISLIRTDFEKMSDVLSEWATEQRDLTSEPPPIQRIILYIDDLDRCRPERVVEVLEAVHLLLAFPLFIVVVGVDPRWLRHSLAQHYPRTLSENGEAGARTDPTAPSYPSTPQDYLEKIFQIPFALRPVEKSGYQNLVADLLKPLPSTADRIQLAQSDAIQRGAAEVQGSSVDRMDRKDDASGEQVDPSDEAQAPIVDEQRKGESPPSADQLFTPINPKQLEFTPQEKRDIDRLWQIFHTPRTVGRFINTYRLLRAGLASGEETTRFEGTEHEPGEYQVALVLLAIVTSAPKETTMFLDQLSKWLEQPPSKDRITEQWYWKDVLSALQTHSVQGDSNWEEFIANLDQTIEDGFGYAFTKDALRKWTWRVTRYSFSVHHIQELS